MDKIKLNTVEEAIEDFRKGEFVIPYHCSRADYA